MRDANENYPLLKEGIQYLATACQGVAIVGLALVLFNPDLKYWGWVMFCSWWLLIVGLVLKLWRKVL